MIVLKYFSSSFNLDHESKSALKSGIAKESFSIKNFPTLEKEKSIFNFILLLCLLIIFIISLKLFLKLLGK